MTQRASAMDVPQVAAPHQLQYLDAMGITTWTARYRIPNAAETPACEWPDVVPVAAAEPPVQRLHSLLDDTSAPRPVAPAPAPVSAPASPSASAPGRMRALLDAANVEQAPQAKAVVSVPVARSETPSSVPQHEHAPVDSAPVQQALRFTLQVAALDDRWLVVLVQPEPPTVPQQRLLSALWSSVGIRAEHVSPFIDFQWPMIEGLMVESPVIEAQQGIKAFLDGRARSGLTPQQLMVFGAHDDDGMKALMQVLALDAASQSSLLGLPVWQAPSLVALMSSGQAKAALWPRLHALGQQWQGLGDTPVADEAAIEGAQ